MGKVLRLVASENKSNFSEVDLDDVDFEGLASDFMNEIFDDFFLLVSNHLRKNNITPTKLAVKKFCESIDNLMGDMDIQEILKEVKQESRRVIQND